LTRFVTSPTEPRQFIVYAENRLQAARQLLRSHNLRRFDWSPQRLEDAPTRLQDGRVVFG
jgi:hypothetical protein